jgi:hypothetical protein
MKKAIRGHSNRMQQNQPKKTDKDRTDLGKRCIVVLVLVSIASIVIASLLLRGTNPSDDSPSAASQTVSTPQTTVPATDFQSLVGQWVRIDSPYVIDIESASQDGTLQAKYYNPRPINVSVARAQEKAGTLEVFVELRDVNYPGSTYTLTYYRERELLIGVYFQATMQQKYNVVFSRLQVER